MPFYNANEEKMPSVGKIRHRLSEAEQQEVLKGIEELTAAPGGGSWYEILGDDVALLAGHLSDTAVGMYYQHEHREEGGRHPRRWFFLLDDDADHKPYAPVCLCVLPEGTDVKSNVGGTCHTTGYMNKNPYPDYAEDIRALAEFIGTPIPANWMQKLLPEYDGESLKP